LRNNESKATNSVPHQFSLLEHPSAGYHSMQQSNQSLKPTESKPIDTAQRAVGTKQGTEATSLPRHSKPDETAWSAMPTPENPSERNSRLVDPASPRTDSGGAAQLLAPQSKKTPNLQRKLTVRPARAAAQVDPQSHRTRATQEPEDASPKPRNKPDQGPSPNLQPLNALTPARNDLPWPGPIARDEQAPTDDKNDVPTPVDDPPRTRPSAEIPIEPIAGSSRSDIASDDLSPENASPPRARFSLLPPPISSPGAQNSTHQIISTDRKLAVSKQSKTQIESAERVDTAAMRWPALSGESGQNKKPRFGVAADRWPDLPVDAAPRELRLSSADVFQAAAAYSRELERHRRLRLEQRGIPWNE
jgi:hypothetical protein